MATETTKTDKTEEAGAKPDGGLDKDTDAPAAEAATGKKTEDTRTETLSAGGTGAAGDAGDPEDADEAGYADETVVVSAAPRRSVGAGAAAVVSAGLGLCSLTGTSFGEMLRERKQLIGQIESSAQGPQGGGSGADQINALYGAPWHAGAMVNGFFALIAVVVGGVLLATVAKRAETSSWVKAVALGGVVLGGIGILVAGGMYFDLFASAPEMPAAPTGPPAQ